MTKERMDEAAVADATPKEQEEGGHHENRKKKKAKKTKKGIHHSNDNNGNINAIATENGAKSGGAKKKRKNPKEEVKGASLISVKGKKKDRKMKPILDTDVKIAHSVAPAVIEPDVQEQTLATNAQSSKSRISKKDKTAIKNGCKSRPIKKKKKGSEQNTFGQTRQATALQRISSEGSELSSPSVVLPGAFPSAAMNRSGNDIEAQQASYVNHNGDIDSYDEEEENNYPSTGNETPAVTARAIDEEEYRKEVLRDTPLVVAVPAPADDGAGIATSSDHEADKKIRGSCQRMSCFVALGASLIVILVVGLAVGLTMNNDQKQPDDISETAAVPTSIDTPNTNNTNNITNTTNTTSLSLQGSPASGPTEGTYEPCFMCGDGNMTYPDNSIQMKDVDITYIVTCGALDAEAQAGLYSEDMCDFIIQWFSSSCGCTVVPEVEETLFSSSP